MNVGRSTITVVIASLVLCLGSQQASAVINAYSNLTVVDAAINGTAASTQAIINGAIFSTNPNSTIVGTGVFNPFVRIQANGVEAGFNTDGTAQFDTKDKGGTNWDHSIKLSDIATREENGIKYREFALDINESGSDSLVSLDQLQIFLGAAGNFDNYSPGSNAPYTASLGGAKKIFDLNDSAPIGVGASGGGDVQNHIALDYRNAHGSGQGIDMTVLIPDSLFDPTKGPYVYLYSKFGSVGQNTDIGGGNGSVSGALPAGDFGANAGFEEWSVRKGTRLGEPSDALLVLVGVITLVASRKRALT